jgi:hypothetical protein
MQWVCASSGTCAQLSVPGRTVHANSAHTSSRCKRAAVQGVSTATWHGGAGGRRAWEKARMESGVLAGIHRIRKLH